MRFSLRSRIYLCLCRSDNTIDQLVMHQLDNKAHIDYSSDPNATGTHKRRTNIDRDRCTIGMIRDMICMFALLDRNIENLSTPCKAHHPAYSAMDTMCTIMVQLLWINEKEKKQWDYFFWNPMKKFAP